MGTTNSKLSFYIEYGWISGKGHGNKLSKLLKANGLKSVASPNEADIIITHSAGFYLVPSSTPDKLLVLVGPTINHISLSNWVRANAENARMFWQDRQIIKGAGLNLLHLADIFLRAKHNARIAYAARKARMPSTRDGQIVMIANRYDPWPHPSSMDDFIKDTPWIFISMPGAHEHIWEQPEEYVKLIEYYAKRILASPNNR